MYSAIFLALSVFFLSSVLSCVLSDKIDYSNLPPSCESEIYCQGELLHDVQLAHLYNDSKTFVDLKLRYPEALVVEKYSKLRSETGGTPSNDTLRRFIAENFEEGNELEVWTPTDFNKEPCLAKQMDRPEYKYWVEQLNLVFLNLSRKVKDDVQKNQELYSLLWVPNGLIIPGGRFLELYYWDTYWISKGLILMQMYETTKGVILNLIHLFRTYGIIPNGSRMYYLRRSQPPLLTHMVMKYYEATGDLEFVRKNIDVLEKEFYFWMANHTVEIEKGGKKHRVARYFAPSKGPRPESYREDYETAENIIDEDEKTRLYINLKAGAETGWDFSTRWIIKDGTNQGNLSDTKATCIIPVDLNAFLHYNCKTISKFYYLLGDRKKGSNFRVLAGKLLMGIHAILWNEKIGMWLDYDMKNNKPRDYFSASNLTPLWTGSYLDTPETVSRYALAYLKRTGANQYIGGIPTTKEASGLQWDFPNGWSPLQAIIVEGLHSLGIPEAIEEAKRLAQKWLDNNYVGFVKYGVMFEKYAVNSQGETGAGGEYEPQIGFGWTIGVVFQFLDKFHAKEPVKC